ncbi:MAG TPA: DUF1993 domain-containing protein [Dokdonella sp.]|uniref:DUF1993 domain-containing protein n=1 Tax=Dokdonella sp. TaxID=2291710 RepID=UPI002D7ECB26|nr:DUF1993 domain-containing protein [Dokdonella sp.]HET9031523.1 DUF1993 domain-containing protein [Dokdonella sp.]
MSLSMYQASVPVFVRALDNLSNILTKAAAHAEQQKIEPSVLLGSRLYPNMFPLSRQIQIATDLVNGGVARLAGIERPVYEDNETRFEELLARIQKTIEFAKSVAAEKIDGSEDKKINLTIGGHEMNFDGQTYLLGFVIPNMYFHTATTYAILRHNGVELGKRDFIGGI